MGSEEVRWLALGFAAATLVAAVADARPAAAQTAPGRPAAGSAASPEVPTRLLRSSTAETEGPDEGGASGLPRSAADDPEEQDPDDTDRPRSGQRSIVLDGDPSYPGEPTQPIDGVIDNSEPEAPIDGVDPNVVDMRDQQDIDLFENPPAGFDPLLFQIEELAPILDRRPERLFRFEPYDPIGIKVGSFVYFPETELNGASFSNVFGSPQPERDVALELKTRSRLVSNWSRHAVELAATSANSFYDEFDSENDKAYAFEARGRLDILRSTNLQASVAHDHAQEDRGAIDASSAGERPDIDTDRANAALTHRFNRLEAQLRASLTDTDISPALDAAGNLISNDERDNRFTDQFLRLTYELKPSFAVFAEGGINQREYKTAPLSDGFLRDGNGERYRIGLDFGEEGKILRGELSVGYGSQDHDTEPLREVDAFLFDSNVTWRVTELTALRLNARTEIGDTTSANASGVVTRSVGLEARHAFRRYFVGTAGVSYTNNDYDGIDLVEDELRVNVDAEYYASREVVLFAKYQHTAFYSSEPDADWDSDEFRFGVKIRR